MKTQFAIECNTESPFVHVFGVTKDFENGKVNYHREVVTSPVFLDRVGPVFFGKLAALLITSQTIEEAPPVEPETYLDRNINAASEAVDRAEAKNA